MDSILEMDSDQPVKSSRQTKATAKRGFAGLEISRRREIASKGGIAAHQKGTAHTFTSDKAREAGKKGGAAVSRNREHMAEIGRKGGATRRPI